jgi:hypothetical protein
VLRARLPDARRALETTTQKRTLSRKPVLVSTFALLALPVLTTVARAQTQVSSPSGPVAGDGEPWIGYQWVHGHDTIFLARADGSDSRALVTGAPGINRTPTGGRTGT